MRIAFYYSLHYRYIYFSLFVGHGKQNKENLVTKTLQACSNYKVAPDIIMFNSAMDAYIASHRTDIALHLFEHVVALSDAQILNSREISALENATTYSNKSEAMSSMPVASEVHQVVKYFASYDLAPNVRTFNILIKGLRSQVQGLQGERYSDSVRDSHSSPTDFDSSNDALLKKCLAAVKLMRKYGIKPDVVTTNTIIDMNVISGRMDVAERIVTAFNFTPSVEGYTSIISGYALKGDTASALRVLHAMEAMNLRPNEKTLTALISSCMRSRDFARAKQLISSKLVDNASRRELVSVYGSYLIGLCKSYREVTDDHENVCLTFKAMEEKGLIADMATLNAYMQFLCAVRQDVRAALELFHRIPSFGLQADDYSYSIMFTALGKTGFIEEAFQLYQSSSTVLDTPAINSLLRALVSGPSPMHAVHVFNRFTSLTSATTIDGFSPNKITFTVLFAALLKDSRSIEQPVKGDEFQPLNFDSSENRFYEGSGGSFDMLNTAIDKAANSASFPRASGSADEYIRKLPKLPSSKYEILNLLYCTMRFKYDVIPDTVMVNTLNALVESITKCACSTVSFKGMHDSMKSIICELYCYVS